MRDDPDPFNREPAGCIEAEAIVLATLLALTGISAILALLR